MADEGATQQPEEDAGRDETQTERMDRNWDELLQELRVTQTGVQILGGFLLTLPFQQRVSHLTRLETVIYLVVVGLATTSTGLIIAPVSFHRLLFRRHEKALLVRVGDRFARLGLVMLALAVSAVVFLVFDVVLSTPAGLIACVLVLGLFVICWFVLPLWSVRGKSTTR